MVTEKTIQDALVDFSYGVQDDAIMQTLTQSECFLTAFYQLLNEDGATDDWGHVTPIGCDLINAFGMGFFAGRNSILDKIATVNIEMPLN